MVAERWLRVFDLVASTGSFTGAARELDVGQPAVSHAIKQLEAGLGVTLFDRGPTGIRLTDAGQDLRTRVRAGLEQLDAGVNEARRRAAAAPTVSLSVSTSLATWWLLPRLASFKQQRPGVELRCITSDTDTGVGLDDADVWIPLGAGPWRSLSQSVLTPERIVAVAAPQVAAALDGVDDAGCVVGADLIHLEERYRPRYDWSRWWADHGLTGTPPAGPTSNDYALVVQAALDGQGVALGWLHIVGPLVDEGRLVAVGGSPVETSRPFVVVHRAQPPAHVTALRDWLIAEAS